MTCPWQGAPVTHAAKSGGKELWPGCKSGPTMGNAPIITMCDPHPISGQEARPPWIHIGRIGNTFQLPQFKSRELKLSEFKSLEVHSSEFNSLKIQLHGITQDDDYALLNLFHTKSGSDGRGTRSGELQQYGSRTTDRVEI